MDAAEALSDLKQISAQVARAVVVGAGGAVEASTLADDASARRMAEGAVALCDAADETAGTLGRPSVVQAEVATPQGSVFVVRDGERVICAVTDPDPTVGLIFYDLKTCLRQIAEEPVADEVEDDGAA
jgi:predicted regulator of Ras-like GTPase activity (Roadblock/LC7/MglB family)